MKSIANELARPTSKTYFEFVKELSLKNNKTFKEVLLDPNTKLMWNQVRPKKVRVKKTVTKLQKIPGVKVDLSRATIIPAEVNQEPDRMLDYYNQRWSNFINSINVENFRDIYTLEKRPKELKVYNLEPIKYLLYDKPHVIEDSPLSYELSSFILSPRVNFPGKRNINIYRADLTNLSTQLKDINMQNQTSEFMYDFELSREGGNSLYDQVYLFHDIFKTLTRKPNVIYLNDMMYPKRVLYSLIFLYGSYLKLFANNRDKYLIVVSNNDLGNNVAGFYKKLDVGYFNSGDFEFGIPDSTPEFNFGKIANYLAGTSSEIAIASTVKKQPTSVVPPVLSIPSVPVSNVIPSGGKGHLSQPFPIGVNPVNIPNQDERFNQRIYFRRVKMIDFSNDKLANTNFNIGNFVYHENGYLSQVTRKPKTGTQSAHISFFNKDDKADDKKLQSMTGAQINTIEFISKSNFNPNAEYTTLRNMAISKDTTYKEVYESLKDYWTDITDNSNVRGGKIGLLQFEKGPNDFIDFIEFQYVPTITKPIELTQPSQQSGDIEKEDLFQSSEEELSGTSDLEGGSLTEDDLVAWLSVFSLKGIDFIGDVGNSQKAYLFTF